MALPIPTSPTTLTPLHLGIDTGGTYTDGVLFDPQQRRIVRTAKVLTDHQDLKHSIAGVLEALQIEDPSGIGFVSLSTTLATNAIAEDKRRPVALFLLGYDPDLVATFRFEEQFATERFFFIPGRHNLDGVEETPLDEEALQYKLAESLDQIEAVAVSSYAGPANAEHEKRAAELIAGQCELPVVTAHQLSSQLDSIRRATTASLNAALLPEAHAFLEAVLHILDKRAIYAPVALLRGDSSLVKAEYARSRPVEIIHSGPATSAIGGQYLAGVKRGLVIDIGGTTTDLILVEENLARSTPRRNAVRGATVGSYRTCVPTIWARSLGLGGDSEMRYDRWRQLQIGPERVLPLAYLGHAYPRVHKELLAFLASKNDIKESAELEYWVLRRVPRRQPDNPHVRRALEILERGPRRVRDLLREVGVYAPFQLGQQDLVNRGLIERAGLTPTDLLHASGEYTAWDGEAAMAALQAAARFWGQTPQQFSDYLRGQITGRIVAEIITYLSGKSLPEKPLSPARQGLEHWLFQENLAPADANLACEIRLQMPIIGIGAPARAFLPPVAQALHTEILIPEHYAVANALGTLVGNVVVRLQGQVMPRIEGAAITGYFARVDNHQEVFVSYAHALAYTERRLGEIAGQRALQAGARQPQVELQVEPLWEDAARVHAWAVGSMSTQAE